MNSPDCLDSKKLIQFTDGELSENENKKIMSHLAECDRCRRNLLILKQLDNILSMQGKKYRLSTEHIKKKEECISDELLFRYLEGKITQSEASAIERHLNSCPMCFEQMASLLRHSLSPATESEKREIAMLRTITPEEQVSKILLYHEQLGRTVSEKPQKEEKFILATIRKLKNSVKKFFEKVIPFEFKWRPALAALTLIILIIGSYWGVQYYHTDYQILKAENILRTKHRVFIEDTRLSGGYRSSVISMLMTPEEEQAAYLEQARSHLEESIKNGSESIKARQLLAQIFIIEKKFDRADSILAKIGKESISSAALLNDIGVLYFQKKDWKNAANNFQLALEIDEKFCEAYYNLALTKEKLGVPVEAILILKKYIKLENDEAWKNAAQHLIKKITKTEQELK